MEIKEAIEILTRLRFDDDDISIAIEKAIYALEKHMPQDARILSMSQAEGCVGYWVCPVCRSGWGDEFEYCPECGQKVRYADE